MDDTASLQRRLPDLKPTHGQGILRHVCGLIILETAQVA